MTNVKLESARSGHISVSKVNVGGVEAVMKQIGSVKQITTTGRGNVRQAKTICRKLHQIINTDAG